MSGENKSQTKPGTGAPENQPAANTPPAENLGAGEGNTPGTPPEDSPKPSKPIELKDVSKPVMTDTLGRPLAPEVQAQLTKEEIRKKAIEEHAKLTGKTVAELTTSHIVSGTDYKWMDQPDGFRYSKVPLFSINDENKRYEDGQHRQDFERNGWAVAPAELKKYWDGVDKDWYTVMRKPTAASEATLNNAIDHLEREAMSASRSKASEGEHTYDAQQHEATMDDVLAKLAENSKAEDITEDLKAALSSM